MSKGSALTRAVRYFKEGDLDEVEVAFELVKRVVTGRLAARDAADKSQRKAADASRPKRKRRGSVTEMATGGNAPGGNSSDANSAAPSDRTVS